MSSLPSLFPVVFNWMTSLSSLPSLWPVVGNMDPDPVAFLYKLAPYFYVVRMVALVAH